MVYWTKQIGALAALLVISSSCATRDIYPELQADKRILVREWTVSTKKTWDWEAGEKGAEFSNPVTYANTLIFGSSGAGLVALYPGINQIRWVLPIENGVVSRIAESSGALFFGGGDGYLYSVNAENGTVNWRYAIRTNLVSRPTVEAGRLLVTTADDAVYAFDAGSGDWLWHYKRRSVRAATIHAASSPLVDRGEVLAGLSDGYLVGLNLQDGKLKWERKLHEGRKFTDVDAHPILSKGVLYIPSYDGALYALNRGTGNPIWRFDAGGSKQPLLEGNRLFLPSSDGNVYALAKESAKRLWKFELDAGVPTQIASAGSLLIVGSSHQYLYVLDKSSGKPLYRFNAGDGSGFHSAPLVDQERGRVYILSGGGNLYSFRLRDTANRKNFARGQSDPYEFFYD